MKRWKTTVRSHFIPTRIATLKKQRKKNKMKITNVGKGVEKLEL